LTKSILTNSMFEHINSWPNQHWTKSTFDQITDCSNHLTKSTFDQITNWPNQHLNPNNIWTNHDLTDSRFLQITILTKFGLFYWSNPLNLYWAKVIRFSFNKTFSSLKFRTNKLECWSAAFLQPSFKLCKYWRSLKKWGPSKFHHFKDRLRALLTNDRIGCKRKK
jgi:hypothetical protein